VFKQLRLHLKSVTDGKTVQITLRHRAGLQASMSSQVIVASLPSSCQNFAAPPSFVPQMLSLCHVLLCGFAVLDKHLTKVLNLFDAKDNFVLHLIGA